MKTKKFYVISRSKYDTKLDALEALIMWEEQDDLKEGSLVYEISEVTKVFRPAIKLEEIK